MNKLNINKIKYAVFVVCLLPLVRLTWLAIQDDLGANPVEFVERSTGTWALIWLLATLAITPLKNLTKLNWLLVLRRMLGLYMFFYACLHLLAYLWLDYVFDWSAIAKDIAKHPYVLVGFAAYLLTLPLACTSNQLMVNRLKSAWKKLHRLVYLIAILAILHFLWLVKKDITEPMIYALVLAFLLISRLPILCKEKRQGTTNSRV